MVLHNAVGGGGGVKFAGGMLYTVQWFNVNITVTIGSVGVNFPEKSIM